MNIFLCDECYERYERELDSCPKLNCEGDVNEIDDFMIPIIVNLWKKGYKTKYCCSGHMNEFKDHFQCYIMFDQEVPLNDLPSGFKLDSERNIVEYVVEEKDWFNLSYIDKLDVLRYTNESLFKWTKGL
jgi:hypothetical protein